MLNQVTIQERRAGVDQVNLVAEKVWKVSQFVTSLGSAEKVGDIGHELVIVADGVVGFGHKGQVA